MSKQVKFFATCNGSAVELTNVYYSIPKYYSDHKGLTQTEPPANQTKHVRYVQESGPSGRIFASAIGQCPACGLRHFAERKIERPSNASNHKCGGRCRAATGPNCECSCKGANHGAGN